MIGLARVDLGDEKHDASHEFAAAVEHHPALGPQDHHFHRCTSQGCAWVDWGPRWECGYLEDHHLAHLADFEGFP